MPELGYFLAGDAAVRLPFGLRIERDRDFASRHPLSLWAQTARIWARSRRPKSPCISSGFDRILPPGAAVGLS
jgi:hypothetical protein